MYNYNIYFFNFVIRILKNWKRKFCGFLLLHFVWFLVQYNGYWLYVNTNINIKNFVGLTLTANH
jgi:hypothetical protein